MNQTYEIFCLSEAVSPITHMSRSEGNESLVAREPVVTPRGVTMVPCLSGNAIRHRMVRSPGWRWLINEYGLRGSLTLPQLNFAFHGGNLTEGGAKENTARIADFQRLFPLGRLIGGCLPDQILAGSLQCWRGALVCEENRDYLGRVLPAELAVKNRLRLAESFVSGYQYTRGDASKTAADLLPKQNGEEAPASNLMIFAGQAVTRGALFFHGFTLPNVSELELGALLWSLSLWQASGGTVGGQAARGHGRLKLSYWIDGADPDAAMDAYLAHARAVKDEAVGWLHSVFAPKADKPLKGKKSKADPEPALIGEDSE